MKVKNDPCSCDSGQGYNACCGEFLKGKLAGTAEQLMRSRYTAYVVANETYLLETWHQSTRPQTLNLAQQSSIKWTGLTILNHCLDADNPGKAQVEFIARYKSNGKAQKMHELSDFVNEDGRWFYLHGKQIRFHPQQQ